MFFTYSFKSSFVLGQLLLAENAILCQKVNCKEKTRRSLERLQDGITSGCSACTRATFQDGEMMICAVFDILYPSDERLPPRVTTLASLCEHVCVQRGLEQYFSPLVMLGSWTVDNTGPGVHRESSWP